MDIINHLVLLPSSIQLTMVFIFSALIGSFLNVVIYRLPIMMKHDWEDQAREILALPAENHKSFDLFKPRSCCRDCGRMVKAFENIPIISYLFMRGKCRGCGSNISIFYLVVELLTAMLATLAFWYFGANLQGICAVFFVFALVALTGIDLKTQLLPDIITISLMWAGIIISFWNVYIPLEAAVIGALLGYLSLWTVARLFKIFFKKEGMGLGDAKLLAAIFAWVHFQYFPLVLMIASVVGLIATLCQRLLNGGKIMNNPLSFGPYLALGGLLALLHGQELTAWYTSVLFG
ncbi:MAG: prepilin peptidase [Ostreibacterium sp.]